MVEAEQPPAIVKFPRGDHQYILGPALVANATASMYCAKHVNPTTGEEVPVGIKIVSMCKTEDIYFLTNEVHEAETCDHENVVKPHRMFGIKDQLWIVMPPLLTRFSSIRSIIRSSFPHGLPEEAATFILRETLKGLNYLHAKNMLHKDIGTNCIFLDEKPTVKLAFRALTMPEDRFHPEESADVVVPSWIPAPELMADYRKGYSKAADIWMFGLLALELLHGQIPASLLQELKVIDLGINDYEKKKKKPYHQRNVAFKAMGKLGFRSCLSTGKQKKWIPEGTIGEVITACLVRDPKKRPTAERLMDFELFRRPIAGEESLKALLQARE